MKILLVHTVQPIFLPSNDWSTTSMAFIQLIIFQILETYIIKLYCIYLLVTILMYSWNILYIVKYIHTKIILLLFTIYKVNVAYNFGLSQRTSLWWLFELLRPLPIYIFFPSWRKYLGKIRMCALDRGSIFLWVGWCDLSIKKPAPFLFSLLSASCLCLWIRYKLSASISVSCVCTWCVVPLYDANGLPQSEVVITKLNL